MYRVSPFTYVVGAVLTAAIAHAPVRCSPLELRRFAPPAGMNCGAYLEQYVTTAGGYVENPAASDECAYCVLAGTDGFLASVGIRSGDLWRDFGIIWAYVGVNVLAALALYWLLRVPRKARLKHASVERVGAGL